MNKQAAKQRVRETYKRLKQSRQETEEEFAQACKDAHEAGLSDEQISLWIDGGYSRSRIQQLRKGKPIASKKDKNE